MSEIARCVPAWTPEPERQQVWACSYPLHLSLAEEPIRTNQQNHDHDEVGRDEVEVGAEEAARLVALREHVDESDSDAAHHGAQDRVESAENDGRKRRQRTLA